MQSYEGLFKGEGNLFLSASFEVKWTLDRTFAFPVVFGIKPISFPQVTGNATILLTLMVPSRSCECVDNVSILYRTISNSFGLTSYHKSFFVMPKFSFSPLEFIYINWIYLLFFSVLVDVIGKLRYAKLVLIFYHWCWLIRNSNAILRTCTTSAYATCSHN